MKVFVVPVSGAAVGGIETLLLRLAPLLQRDGDELLVCGILDDIAPELPRESRFVKIESERTMALRLGQVLAAEYRAYEVVLVSLHPWTLAAFYPLRYLLRARGMRDVRSFHLVTHSRAFFFSGYAAVNALLKAVFCSAPVCSTFFMNDASVLAHAAYWRADLSDYPVLRLPLAPPKRRWNPCGDGSLRIASVGRLVPFKGYNRVAPAITRQLVSDGQDAFWNIWGDGEDAGLVAGHITREGMADRVRLHGPLDYARLAESLAEHDLFVGMGTAVLEAAHLGMPAICALEGSADLGYGFLYQAPGDSVGDVVAGAKPEPLLITVQRFAAMDADQRRAVGAQCEANVRDRSGDLEDFAAAIRDAAPWPARLDIGSLALAVLISAAIVPKG